MTTRSERYVSHPSELAILVPLSDYYETVNTSLPDKSFGYRRVGYLGAKVHVTDYDIRTICNNIKPLEAKSINSTLKTNPEKGVPHIRRIAHPQVRHSRPLNPVEGEEHRPE